MQEHAVVEPLERGRERGSLPVAQGLRPGIPRRAALLFLHGHVQAVVCLLYTSTYKNTWYWGSASGLVDGERFGFNIGYGFGNTSAASENMLFYKGRAHKLSQVIFHIPGDGGRATPDYMRPWTFTSDDGRFEMDYTPVLDRASCSDVGLIKSDQHQVFGVFNGRAVLDDGTVLNVKDLPGFAEKVINKW